MVGVTSTRYSSNTDTTALRNYGNDTIFSTHKYVVGYSYDAARRRTAIHHTGALLGGSADSTRYVYNAQGFLVSVTDPQGNAYTFGYDDTDRPWVKNFPGSGFDSLQYDLGGRLVGRKINTAALTDSFFNWTLTHDDRDKLTSATAGANAATMVFSGLGQLQESTDVTYFGSFDVDSLTIDGLGNVTIKIAEPAEGGDNVKYESAHDIVFGRLDRTYEVWNHSFNEPVAWMPDTLASHTYDGSGNRAYTFSSRRSWADLEETPSITSRWAEESRNYYGLDDRLMIHQSNRDSIPYYANGTPNTAGTKHRGVYEEYWYDALGRRVLKRSMQDSPLCDMNVTGAIRCQSHLERYIWDGDQLLYEIRRTDTSDLFGASSGDQTGQIVYVHSAEIDAPLGMIRNGTAIMLHRDWRGQYAFSTDTSGQHTTCVLSSSPCSLDDVNWPAGTRRAYLDSRWSGDIGIWYGSLTASQSDASGMLYRRNRYYDPQSGQFTQEDPIGIAGGLNLYGYANGDPINYSDPFGLDPCEALWPENGADGDTSAWQECKRQQYAEEDAAKADEGADEGASVFTRCAPLAAATLISGIADVAFFSGAFSAAGFGLRGAASGFTGAAIARSGVPGVTGLAAAELASGKVASSVGATTGAASFATYLRGKATTVPLVSPSGDGVGIPSFLPVASTLTLGARTGSCMR